MDDFATGYLAGQDAGGGTSGGNGGFFGGDGIWAILLFALSSRVMKNCEVAELGSFVLAIEITPLV